MEEKKQNFVAVEAGDEEEDNDVLVMKDDD